ncbi:MAG: chemotaxis protein CheW [Bdellovibrionia bacterium]
MNKDLSPSQTFLIFSIGPGLYGLPIKTLQEVLLLSELSRPPGLPPAIEGFLKLGPRLLPILRLDKLFDLPELTLDLYTPVLIFRKLEHPYGLIVEKILEIVTVTQNQLIPIEPTQSFRGSLEAELQLGSKTVHIFNLHKLLDAQEKQAIAHFKNEEENHRQKLGVALP